MHPEFLSRLSIVSFPRFCWFRSAFAAGWFVVFWVGLSLPVWAQSLPDESLGAEQSKLSIQDDREVVTGGAVRGSQLFHSFETLNVAEGRSLYFSPADPITHIFSRVTGRDPSTINGTLGVLGDADLFLLNPNGILFGPNAQLDLAGSFAASTASGLQFEGFGFSATQPQTVPPLLSISVPLGIHLGINFGISFGSNPGSIVNQSVANGTGLSVQPGRSLSLLGGDIRLTGGRITVVDGRIELESQGAIALTDQSVISINNLVGHPASEIRLTAQDITLEEQSRLLSGNASPQAGANIALEAQTLDLRNGSQIVTATIGTGDGGHVIAKVPEKIWLTNEARDGSIGEPSFMQTITLNTATGGNIQVETGELLMEYNGYLTSETGAFSAGDGGDITIRVTRSVVGQKSSPSNRYGGGLQLGTRGSGSGGNLTLKTPLLSLTDHHSVLSTSWLSGQGGNLQIEADKIRISNDPQIRPPVTSGIRAMVFGSGNGGDIDIETQDLSLDTGGLIVSLAEVDRDDALREVSILDPSLQALLGLPNHTTGDLGDVNVVADTIVIDGFHPLFPASPSQISSITRGTGNAGNVTLTSRELKLLNGGGTGSSSLFALSRQGVPLASGSGNGGSLTINADDITVAGSNPMTELGSLIGTQTGAFGNAGDTKITTRRLRVLDGGLINSGTLTSGNGGRLEIDAQELIQVDGINANGQASTIGTFALKPSEPLRRAFSLPPIPEGETQALQLRTDELQLTNGGTISAEHQGIGNASDVNIQATQVLLDQGSIIAETASGLGGDITLDVTNNLQLRNRSQITATVRGSSGDSGNIKIFANTVLAVPVENSDIIANSQNGRGGNILFKTKGLFGLQFQEQLTPQSDITASSKVQGLEGSVNIDLLAPNPVSSLATLPSQIPNFTDQIVALCGQTADSQFVVSGRGGIPANPRHHLSGIYPLQDWRTAATEPVLSQQSNRATDRLETPQSPSRSWLEATGWRLDVSNQIQLVSEPMMRDSVAFQQHCSDLKLFKSS